jgi:hypothetical protein
MKTPIPLISILVVTILMLVRTTEGADVPTLSQMKTVPLDAKFILRCKAAAQKNEAWTHNPDKIVLEMLGGLERTDTGSRRIMTTNLEDKKAVVTVDTKGIPDDSIFEEFDEVTLTRQGDAWIPTTHKRSNKGRGVKGWSIGPFI